jgi:plastocyanin
MSLEDEEVELKRPLLMVIVVGALAYASVASAATTQIQVDDNFFAPRTPATRNLASGASFHWQRASGSSGPHNIRQNVKLFYSGAVTSGPIDFSIRASAGSYHYYCERHGSSSGGMDGVVRVRPVFAAAPDGAPFTVKWALPVTTPGTGTNTGNRFDVRFRVGATTTWTLWKNDVEARSGVFGQNGQPVQVMPGTTYQFQARSLKASAPNQPSGWSPTLTVTP